MVLAALGSLEPASGGSSIIVPVAGHSVEYGTVCTSAQLPNKQAFSSPQHALSTHPAPAHAVAHSPAGGNYANAMQPGLLEEQLGQGTCVIRVGVALGAAAALHLLAMEGMTGCVARGEGAGNAVGCPPDGSSSLPLKHKSHAPFCPSAAGQGWQ